MLDSFYTHRHSMTVKYLLFPLHYLSLIGHRTHFSLFYQRYDIESVGMAWGYPGIRIMNFCKNQEDTEHYGREPVALS